MNDEEIEVNADELFEQMKKESDDYGELKVSTLKTKNREYITNIRLSGTEKISEYAYCSIIKGFTDFILKRMDQIKTREDLYRMDKEIDTIQNCTLAIAQKCAVIITKILGETPRDEDEADTQEDD